MGLSTATANAILDALFNQGTLDDTAVWISLHTADPGDNGANEVSGGSYARQNGTAAFAAASGKAVTNTAILLYETLPAVTVTHAGVWTAQTGGTWRWGSALTTPRTFALGDDGRFKAGELDFSIS